MDENCSRYIILYYILYEKMYKTLNHVARF